MGDLRTREFDTMEERNIAVYLDFENLALGAEETYPSQMLPLKLGPIIDYLATKGNICIRKAYADWSNPAFSVYQRDLIEAGFEMIHMPGTSSRGKAGADVKLAIDAVEMLDVSEHLNSIVIGSGDTDFIPLIQRLRSRGKEVIVIGFEHTVGTLLKRNCTEYRGLEEILGEQEKEAVSIDVVHEAGNERGRDLMLRYLSTYLPDEPVPMERLKPDLLRLDPSFSERRFGYKTFKNYVESFVGDLVERIETNPTTGLPQVLFKEVERAEIPDKSAREKATQFLNANLKFPKKISDVEVMSSSLYNIMDENDYLSMREMVTLISKDTKGISKLAIRKFINTLFTSHAFTAEASPSYVPLATRRFKLGDGIRTSVAIKEEYLDRIREILEGKFPDLEEDDIAVLVRGG